MQKKSAVIFRTALILAINCFCGANASGTTSTAPVDLVRIEKEFSSAHLEPARMAGQKGIAVIFEGTDNLHYYARAETAPAVGFELKVEAKSENFVFDKPVLPMWDIIVDPLGKKVEVYAGRFTIFVPIKKTNVPTRLTGPVKVKISGQTCTNMVCLPPSEKTLPVTIDYSQADSWKDLSLESTPNPGRTTKTQTYLLLFALLLAILAVLALGIYRASGRTPYILLTIFALLLLCGIFLGEVGRALQHAATVCLECIGIG